MNNTKINRRNALKKLGKFTAYTAPAVVTILSPTAASAHPAASGTYKSKMACKSYHSMVLGYKKSIANKHCEAPPPGGHGL